MRLRGSPDLRETRASDIGCITCISLIIREAFIQVGSMPSNNLYSKYTFCASHLNLKYINMKGIAVSRSHLLYWSVNSSTVVKSAAFFSEILNRGEGPYIICQICQETNLIHRQYQCRYFKINSGVRLPINVVLTVCRTFDYFGFNVGESIFMRIINS